MRSKTLLLISIFLLTHVYSAYGINMDAIKQIESSGNPKAYNRSSGAIGLYQITSICLEEYNRFHKIKYSRKDLYNPDINYQIADWYLHIRIPQMLRYYKKTINDDNTIWAYNAGIGYVIKGIMPTETIKYIKKYKRLTEDEFI